MMTDPDILAIARKRRQEGRCVACGRASGRRAVLCRLCAEAWRYCPRCEAVYDAALVAGRDHGGYTSLYCPPCHNIMCNGPRQSRAAYLAQDRQHPRLKEIVRLYRKGLPYHEMAAALGMPLGTLSSIIVYARQTGRWPKGLKREVGKRAIVRGKHL